MPHITLLQRYIIAVLKKEGFKQVEIVQRIGKDKSVISRELSRNADLRNGVYRADLANRKAQKRKQENPKRVHFTENIKRYVAAKLRQYLSPKQIVGECKVSGLKCVVSVESIYQPIWKDSDNGKEFATHKSLRSRFLFCKKPSSLGARL